MNGSRISVLIALVILASLGSVSVPVATVPHLISLEGRLTNPSNGEPITGTVTITFRIWSALTGGIMIWQETQTITLDGNGFFHATLGLVNPLPILPESSYLELQIGGEVLSPRTLLTASPFALTAETSPSPWVKKRLSSDIRTIDSTGNVGFHTSVTIGIDGLPVISYWDGINRRLKVAKCGNMACSSGNTITPVDFIGDNGEFSSITIGVDGLPVISYYESNIGDLRVAKCGNMACSSGNTITTVDITGNVGLYTSIIIGFDGFPIISYQDGTNGNLKVAKCGNMACSSGNTITPVDSTGNVGHYTSITIGVDGLPVISYYDSTNGDLKVAKCGNMACSSGNTITPVDSTGTVGVDTSIIIGVDGFPIVSYLESINGDLKVAKCGNMACSSGNTITTVDSTGNVGRYSSITIGVDGLPVISYHDLTNIDLKVAKCGNMACSSGNTITTVDSTGNMGGWTSITIGVDGLPVMSYHDYTNGDLKVAKCGNPACLPFWTRR